MQRDVEVGIEIRRDLVIIQVYITNAYRAYQIADHYRARGSYVALGGLHVTSLPDEAQNRIETRNWDLYDTRNVVYRPSRLSPEELKRGYDWAYDAFYRWSNIFEASSAHASVKHRLKHFFYSAGWKKFERAWDFVIRIKQLSQMLPILEAVLAQVRPDEAMEPRRAPLARLDELH